MAMTSDGNVVTASSDSCIRVWSLQEAHEGELVRALTIANEPGEMKSPLTQQEHSTPSVPFTLFSASYSSAISHEGGIRCLALSPDETHLASGDRSGNVRVHELDDFACVSTLPAHDAEVVVDALASPLIDSHVC